MVQALLAALEELQTRLLMSKYAVCLAIPWALAVLKYCSWFVCAGGWTGVVSLQACCRASTAAHDGVRFMKAKRNKPGVLLSERQCNSFISVQLACTLC